MIFLLSTHKKKLTTEDTENTEKSTDYICVKSVKPVVIKYLSRRFYVYPDPMGSEEPSPVGASSAHFNKEDNQNSLTAEGAVSFKVKKYLIRFKIPVLIIIL